MEFEFDSQSSFLIKGRGCHLEHPRRTINLQNSGTSIRLITGILAGLNLSARLDGDESLRRRPMERIATPLRKMGAIINLREEDFPPIDIISSKRLEAIEYTLPVASAQVKSAVIFASLFANGTSVVRELTRTRDHTERMLAQFGVDLRVEDKEIKIQGRTEGGIVTGALYINNDGDIELGLTNLQPVLTKLFKTIYDTHTHGVSGTSTTPPTKPLPDSIFTQKTKLS